LLLQFADLELKVVRMMANRLLLVTRYMSTYCFEK